MGRWVWKRHRAGMEATGLAHNRTLLGRHLHGDSGMGRLVQGRNVGRENACGGDGGGDQGMVRGL